MNGLMHRTFKYLLITGLLGAGAGSVLGDVTMVYRTSSSGFHGMGASEGTEKRMVQGLRSRREDHHKMTGAVLGTMTRPRDSVTLTFLEKEVIDTLDPQKKTYTELSLKDMREAGNKAKQRTTPEEKTKPSGPTHKITKAEFKVTPSEEVKAINGFSCKRYLLEMILEVEDLSTHQKSMTRMLDTLWMTPQTAELKKAQQEEQAFGQAFMQKMGLNSSPGDVRNFGSALAANLTGAGEKELSQALAHVPQEMKKLQGFPVVTQVDWYLAGSELKDQEKKESQAEASRPDTPVDLSNGVSGALGGLASSWAKKKVDKKMEQHARAQEGQPAFSLTSELESVSTEPLAESLFAIPAPYKRITQ